MDNLPPTFTIPTDSLGWIALLLLVLPWLAQLITALIIRARPDTSSADRFSLSVIVSFVLMMGPGWALLIELGFSHFDVPSFMLLLPAGLTVAGGKEIVYRVLIDFWKRITTVPPAPTDPPFVATRGAGNGVPFSQSIGIKPPEGEEG